MRSEPIIVTTLFLIINYHHAVFVSADSTDKKTNTCYFVTQKSQFLTLIFGSDYLCNNLPACPINEGRPVSNGPDLPSDNITRAEKTYYLCGGSMSKMPSWFKSRQMALIPAVHVVNASLFFSSSKNKQQEAAEKSKLDNVTSLDESNNDASNVEDETAAKDTNNWCMLVNFFAPHCPFSAKLAPNYNALARSFPYLFVAAVDATQNAKLNLIFGISGTPTVVLFQNGRPVARYDQSDYNHKSLVDFITKQTDLTPRWEVNVLEADQFGPLADFIKDIGTDYYLLASWYFIVICSIYYFFKSSIADKLLETVERNWREMNEE